ACCDVEPESQSSVMADRCDPLEARKDALQILGRDPWSAIADLDACALAVGFDGDVDGSAGAELDRVVHEVRHHLLEAYAVPMAADSRHDVGAQLAVGALGRGPQAVAHLRDELAEIERHRYELESFGAQPRDVEQVLDQPGEPLAAAHHPCESTR